jgi:hypothetical protein
MKGFFLILFYSHILRMGYSIYTLKGHRREWRKAAWPTILKPLHHPYYHAAPPSSILNDYFS